MRTLIIGMNNPHRAGDPLSPHKTAGKRLFECSGLSLAEYLAKFERRNLLEARKWDQEAARKAARRMKIRPGRQVILLGKAVAEAFKAAGKDMDLVVVLPHPSGRNRLWNDNEITQSIRKVLRR